MSLSRREFLVATGLGAAALARARFAEARGLLTDPTLDEIVKRPVALVPAPPAVDVWQTPLVKDPFKIPVADKAELLLAANAEAMKVPGVRFVTSSVQVAGEWKLYASSDGAYTEQSITRI